MILQITSDAEADIVEGYWFYEKQLSGLGNHFRTCMIEDIESLAKYGGVHEIEHGCYRALSKKFPFCLYYSLHASTVTIIAVIDARRDPLWIRARLQ